MRGDRIVDIKPELGRRCSVLEPFHPFMSAKTSGVADFDTGSQ
jgi:hypothetical protein